MKILYVSTISNTINAFLVPHINMLIEYGNTVDIACKVMRPIDEKLTKIGCTVHEIEFSRTPFKNQYLKLIKKIKDLVRNGNYEIVHTHTPIASAIVRIACRNLKNVKIIYTAHGFHFYNGAPLINWLTYYPIERYLAKYTDILITINQQDYEKTKDFKSTYSFYVPGVGVDIDNNNMSEREKAELKETLNITSNNVFISVGELNNNKNQKIVIDAFSRLKDKDFQYLIVGKGPNKDKLYDLIREYNLEDKIQLLGYRDDVNHLFQVSDIFIFPSYREGLSRSLMEAMSVGLPAIVTDIRGNTDLVDQQKGGLLFNPTNSDDLAKEIQTLMDSSELQDKFGSYNFKKINSYSTQNVLVKMKKIYALAENINKG
ncbi:glycosyltransferase family 4 protein [Aerococcus viridans]|uniref:glycosyltransferase family 4 protein n=1 Tax=Aerococcus viridans TaxID=1377 RepID=UPI00223C4B77|nr:glycosyltransferase family 4 protein [Aerococcus viridans]MCT1797319.1 glycosyltransferase family 4 protein [Aerococcus viridans]